MLNQSAPAAHLPAPSPTHHSYSRAAEALYLSQPAVSLQVRALEKTIGLPLFEKSGRTLQTDRGRPRTADL